MLFFGFKLFIFLRESLATEGQISALNEVAEVAEIPASTPDDDAICSACAIRDNSPYWRYLDTPFISVNLPALQQENPETVGWLQVLGTNINYPFVQTSDNSFYLSHSFDRSRNAAGWVFLDYRNDANLGDRNNIIYAHGRTDRTMFGSLRNLLSSSWLDNPENYLLRTKTADTSAVWAIFSTYQTPPTSDYLQTAFASDADFVTFFTDLQSKSLHDFGTFTPGDILTLSTCYNNDLRLVVHAVKIKIY